jgi:hypothetical protein
VGVVAVRVRLPARDGLVGVERLSMNGGGFGGMGRDGGVRRAGWDVKGCGACGGDIGLANCGGSSWSICTVSGASDVGGRAVLWARYGRGGNIIESKSSGGSSIPGQKWFG